MLTALRSQKAMRRILIATMILVLPSFVLFYGWSQIGQAQVRRDASYGDVVVAAGGRREEVMIDSRAIQRVAEEMAFPVIMRLFQANPQGAQFDFERWQRLLRGGLSDEFLLHQAARGIALRQEADALGFEVTTEAAARALRRQMPAATERQLREAILREQGVTLEQFLERESGRMAEARMRQLQAYQVRASLFEVWQEYLLQNEQVAVDYVSFRMNDFLAGIEPTEEETLAFFEKHRELFRVPARVKLAYVKKTGRELAEQIGPQLGDEEIAAFYEANKEQSYKVPASARVRQMFFRIDDARSEADALDLAAAARLRVELGEDFGELANVLSEWTAPDASSEDRLAVAGFGAGGLVTEPVTETSALFSPSYREAVAATAAGALAEPFVGEYGMGEQRLRGAFLVRVDEKTEASFTPLEEVRESIVRRLSNERSVAELDALQAKWEAGFQDHTTIAGFAEWAGLPVEGPEEIAFDGENVGFLPGVGSLRRSRGTIEMLKLEGGVGVMRVGNALVAVEVLDSRAGYVPRRIDDDKDTSPALANAVRRNLAARKAAEAATEFYDAVRATPDLFGSLADEKALQVSSAGPAVRTALQDPMLMQIEDFGRKTLLLPAGSIQKDGAFLDPAGAPMMTIVWRLTEKVEPSMDTFREEFSRLEQGYLASKADGMLDERFADQVRSGAIRVTPNPRLRQAN